MQELALFMLCVTAFVTTVGYHIYNWFKYTNAECRRQTGESAFIYCIIVGLWGYSYLSSVIETTDVKLESESFLLKLYEIIFLLASMIVVILLAKITSDERQSPY